MSPVTVAPELLARGEVAALVINLSNEPFTIEPNMRVAQMVVAKYEVMGWNVVETLDETDRGAGGFGSSGGMTKA